MSEQNRSEQPGPAVGARVDRGVGRLVPQRANVGDTVACDVRQPRRETYTLTLTTQKAADYASELLADRRSGWRLVAVAPRNVLPAERECCGTFHGSPHRATCQQHPLGRHCQNGGDVCLAGNADGICCPEDSCDIDDGARQPPNPQVERRPSGRPLRTAG